MVLEFFVVLVFFRRVFFSRFGCFWMVFKVCLCFCLAFCGFLKGVQIVLGCSAVFFPFFKNPVGDSFPSRAFFVFFVLFICIFLSNRCFFF